MEIIRSALHFCSSSLVCRPPSEQPEQAIRTFKQGDLPSSLMEDLQKQIFEKFFDILHNGHQLTAPLCLATELPVSILKPLLLNLGREILCRMHSTQTSCQDKKCFWCNASLERLSGFLIFLDLSEEDQPIDRIRKLQLDYALKSEQKLFVLFLCRMETITAGAQDSLLKFLEEPSGPVQIILTTRHFQYLKPTLLSRCLKGHIFLETNSWKSWINEYISKDLSGLLRLYTGNPLELIKSLQNCNSIETRKIFSCFFDAYRKKSLMSLIKVFFPTHHLDAHNFRLYTLFLSDWAKSMFIEEPVLKKLCPYHDLNFIDLKSIDGDVIQKCWLSAFEAGLDLMSSSLNVELVFAKMLANQQRCLKSMQTKT